MSRISRENMFMQVAHTVAQRSTCHRLNVGAILVVDANIVSMGYNGAPTGQEHCGGTGCQYFHREIGCGVVHAEQNAIARAPVGISRGSLYVTHSPCVQCARLIAEATHIREVYFEIAYRDPAGITELLRHSSISVRRLQPSGYLMDMRTEEVIRL